MQRTVTITTVLCAAIVSACAGAARTPAKTVPVPSSRPSAPVAPPVAQQARPASGDTSVIVAAKPFTPDSLRLDSTAVARRATEVFGDAPSVPEAAPADATATGPSWDIEVHSYESTDRVEHYVKVFTGRAKERIAARLEQGTKYESMIRARMRDGGIPEDMYYLALIESGFDPNAYSRAAAVGMWQFMTSTARDMGLRVDWWVDERRDPFKSTTAAVRFIKGLRDQFGSLYLAAAAYNGGPGRIARGLTRYADDLEGTTGDDLFFALAEKDYLRNETREYVPQLIAAALIAKEPEKYGMSFTAQPALTYDSVRVGPSTSLSAVAKAAGASSDAIHELNSFVLRGVTPPRDSFFVRVPAGRGDSAVAEMATMPKSERIGLVTMESKKGESFESIARKNGVSARQLILYNPNLKRLKSGNLAPGQTVLVPTSATASLALSVPDPDIERWGSSSKGVTMYVVKSGETLGGIAKKYRTTTNALMKANGLKKPLIFPGQSLVVKGGRGAGEGRRVATKPASPSKAAPKVAAKAAPKKATSTKKAPPKAAAKKTAKAATKRASAKK